MASTVATLLLSALLLTSAPIASFSFSTGALPGFTRQANLPIRSASAACTPLRRAPAPVAQTTFFGTPAWRVQSGRVVARLRDGHGDGILGMQAMFGAFDGASDDDGGEWDEVMEDEDWEGDRMVILRDPVGFHRSGFDVRVCSCMGEEI